MMPTTHDASHESVSPEHVPITNEKSSNGHTTTKSAESRVVDQCHELHTMLAQLSDILITKDDSGLLQQDTGMSTIRSNINAYTSIKEYKHDLKRVFLSKPNLKDLYQFALATLQFETQRLDKNYDQSNDDNEDVQEHEGPIALFRPTLDGFLFTDAVPAATLEDKLLPLGVQEMVIHPAPSMEHVPTLKQTIPPPPRFPSRIHRHEDKHAVPIQWLDYGAFSSFAPTRDSNHANVSYESTYMGRAAKRFRRWEKKQRATTGKHHPQQQHTASSAAVEIDTDWLASQGLDADAIVAAAQAGTYSMDDLLMQQQQHNTTDAQLERTGELLDYLAQYQDHRFSSNQGVDSGEQAVAEAVEKNIKALVARATPKDLVDPAALEAAMRRVPLRQAAYRGGLPPNKIFGYPTTQRLEPVPPVATVVPGYPKERWKLVDVTGPPPPPPNAGGSGSGGTSGSTSRLG